ncbi:MAG: hypothetical protein K2X74_00655 [Acetobacteraceae bacterium]|nr:hypothetical protein [Acetobacteraceae bacterium]
MDQDSALIFPVNGNLRWCGRPQNAPPDVAPWRASSAHNTCDRHEPADA